MKFKKVINKNSAFHLYEDKNFAVGFTEIGSEIEDIGEYFGIKKIIQLEQVHGNKIFFSKEVKEYPDGDGIILNERNVMAVIRTADCTPLFFWSFNGKTGGVIHIGWRGLHSQIGVKLLNMLKEKGTGTVNLQFFTGPAIEGKCYTVQQDVVDKFKEFSFVDRIFSKTPDGYSMDVKTGIEWCLKKNGVPAENIAHSGICTFCNPAFPSYRRGDREKRIFNFIMLK